MRNITVGLLLLATVNLAWGQQALNVTSTGVGIGTRTASQGAYTRNYNNDGSEASCSTQRTMGNPETYALRIIPLLSVPRGVGYQFQTKKKECYRRN